MEAQCAALRNVLFEGCPNTQYSKALMEDGEITSKEKYQQYFEVLLSKRYSDFITFYEATSAFKKGDKKKGTEYVVEVKVLNLRKDLETNGVKRKIGL
jgi:ABC-type transporter MlaC component